MSPTPSLTSLRFVAEVMAKVSQLAATGTSLFGHLHTFSYLLTAYIDDYPFTYSLSNQLKVCQHDTGGLQTVDLTEDPLDDPFRDESSPTTVMSINSIAKSVEQFTPAGSNSFIDNFFPEVRPDEKVLHCAWHPTSNHVAVAGRSGLCIYNA